VSPSVLDSNSLEPDHAPSGDNRVLVISPYGCGPPHSGNRTRVRTLLQQLKQMGLEVHFAWAQIPDETNWARLSLEARQETAKYVDHWVHDFLWDSRTANGLSITISKGMHFLRRHTRRGRERHSKGIHRLDGWFHADWRKQARALQRQHNYSRVVVAYLFSSGFLKAFPKDTLKIIDCHDSFTCRNDALSHKNGKLWWYSVYSSDERRGLLRADHILGIQHEESHFFNQLIKGKRPVFTVGHFTEICPLPFNQNCVNTFGIIASGTAVNKESLEWFLREVWPLVKTNQPHSIFLIAGSVASGISPGNGVKPVGQVSFLAEFYSQLLFAINPIRLGTGLKIKTVEAMSFGRPVVATTCGASGLDAYHGNGLKVANSAVEFAEAVISMLADPAATMADGSVAKETAESINVQSRKELAKALGLGMAHWSG